MGIGTQAQLTTRIFIIHQISGMTLTFIMTSLS